MLALVLERTSSFEPATLAHIRMIRGRFRAHLPRRITWEKEEEVELELELDQLNWSDSQSDSYSDSNDARLVRIEASIID